VGAAAGFAAAGAAGAAAAGLATAGAGGAAAAGFATAGAAVGAAAAGFFTRFAGRLLPNDPLNIFPFLVFLSPLPIIMFFQSYKKLRYLHSHARQRSFAIRRSPD
jgi:hypothetical protein